MLTVEGIETHYGTSQALYGVSLTVQEHEVITLLGRNGMGKTTTVSTVMGLLKPSSGSVTFEGDVVSGLPAHAVARRGLGLVPEGRHVFPNLTVRENLVATAVDRGADGWTYRTVTDLFPRLRERADQFGGQLSGGEQQMLAIGRALMTNPKLLILDEATEGLAPLIRQEIWSCLEGLRSRGQAILVIDKDLKTLNRLADRHNIIEKGKIVWTGTPDELQAAPAIAERYLGL